MGLCRKKTIFFLKSKCFGGEIKNFKKGVVFDTCNTSLNNTFLSGLFLAYIYNSLASPERGSMSRESVSGKAKKSWTFIHVFFICTRHASYGISYYIYLKTILK